MSDHDAQLAREPRTYPPIAEIVPHKPPMVLLDVVTSHTPEATTCSVQIAAGAPFAGVDGNVPNWVAVEYMAQCAAAHSGLCERAAGAPIRIGFLLGSRRVVFHTPHFELGCELEVSAREAWSDGEMASFTCTVRERGSGRLLAECELSAYSPKHLHDVSARPAP